MGKKKGKGRNQSVPAHQPKYEGRNNTKRTKKSGSTGLSQGHRSV